MQDEAAQLPYGDYVPIPKGEWSPFKYDLPTDGERKGYIDAEDFLALYSDMSDDKRKLMRRIIGDNKIFPANIKDADRLANTLGPLIYGDTATLLEREESGEDLLKTVFVQRDKILQGGYPFSVAMRLINRMQNTKKKYLDAEQSFVSSATIENLVAQQLALVPEKLDPLRYDRLANSDSLVEWNRQLASMPEPEINLLLFSEELDSDRINSKENKIHHINSNGNLFSSLGRDDLFWKLYGM